MQDILKDSPDGVLCYQDELSGWFGAMDKYSAGRGSAKDRAFWLEAFNGGSYSVSRVGRGSVFIENLSISLIGGIQPEPICKIVDDSVDDGLLQRLLPITLKPAVAGETTGFADRVTLCQVYRQSDRRRRDAARFDEGAQRYRQEPEAKHLKLQSLEIVKPEADCPHRQIRWHFCPAVVIWHCIEIAPAFDSLIYRTSSVDLEICPMSSSARTLQVASEDFLASSCLTQSALRWRAWPSNDHDSVSAVAGYSDPQAGTDHQLRSRVGIKPRRLKPHSALSTFEQRKHWAGGSRAVVSEREADDWLVKPYSPPEVFRMRQVRDGAARGGSQMIAEAVDRGSSHEPPSGRVRLDG